MIPFTGETHNWSLDKFTHMRNAIQKSHTESM